jgi:hypothetical protein
MHAEASAVADAMHTIAYAIVNSVYV